MATSVLHIDASAGHENRQKALKKTQAVMKKHLFLVLPHEFQVKQIKDDRKLRTELLHFT